MDNAYIKLEDFPAYLKCLGPDDWRPLLELIPEIENAEVFGEEKGGGLIEPGVYSFPYWDQSALVSKFVQLAYQLRIVIDFNWPAWDEGRKLAAADNPKLDSMDLLKACKLITAIIRNDRFCDGALVSSFKNGLMPKILYRIREILQRTTSVS